MIGPILEAVTAGEKPALAQLTNLSKASRRMLQILDQLTLCDGVLCRRYEGADGLNTIAQIVVPKVLRDAVLADLHEGTLGAHLGVDKTLARLKEWFYWPGHHQDVRNWCDNCGVCATRKNPAPKAKSTLKSIVVGYPLQLVAMDIVGPFPESPDSNTYVLVVADYFTRWTEAYALPNQEASTVARKLVDEFFLRFSPPEQLHSDQGPKF